jgi:hypothetical protein
MNILKSNAIEMFRLSASTLGNAVIAVKNHGYGDFFPEPPELEFVQRDWHEVHQFLESQDLDVYAGYDVMSAFAPKSRLNVRRVALLHPHDLLLYTALVLDLRDGVSLARLSPTENRVFSYRAENAGEGELYLSSPNYSNFKKEIQNRVAGSPGCFVGTTDIGDFYPRVYQHRLINALQAACGASQYDQIRVLEKMLFRFSGGASYGIPVGPAASRVLGEAVLIDVDSTLLSNQIDFIRFTDDYLIFSSTPEGAEYGIRVLGETLFMNHGLTLQTAKTRVLAGSDFTAQYLEAHDEKEAQRRELIDIVGQYDEQMPYQDLPEDKKLEIDAMNLSEMLTDALAEGANVDFREVSFILGRLSALQKPELIPIVLQNVERLAPVAHSIAAFFKGFRQLDSTTRKSVADTLLAAVGDRRFSEYYGIWILHLFSNSPDWNHAEALLKIFRESNSDVIRRYAALALRVCGTRAHAIEVSRYISMASPLTRTAILMATARMGNDERKYLKRGLRLTDTFELRCMTA